MLPADRRRSITDYAINKAGYLIHGCIHRARPDVRAVIHTHTRAGMAVAAMQCGLLPISQTSIRFEGHLAYHDYEGPAVDLAEQARGPSIPEAFNTMYQLELSCRTQVDAMAARTDLVVPTKETLERTAHLYQPGTRRPYGIPPSRRTRNRPA